MTIMGVNIRDDKRWLSHHYNIIPVQIWDPTMYINNLPKLVIDYFTYTICKNISTWMEKACTDVLLFLS